MTPIRILAPSLLALAFVSCASHDTASSSYDTPQPSAPAQPAANAPGAEPANPVYDTPAAYEESGTAAAPAAPAAAAASGAAAAANNIPAASATRPPQPPSNGAAIIHTVVAGDTLSGIAAKYKVPAAAIRQANAMTKDTVVLGRKMVIPPVR